MLTWDYQISFYKANLVLLSQDQRLDIALACISNIRPTAMRVLAGTREATDFVQASLALIGQAHEVSSVPTTAAKYLIDGTASWLPDSGAGVWDVGMSLVTILQRAGGKLTETDLLNVMSFAYQVVLFDQVLSNLQTETTESEVRQIEASNPVCLACIARHIQLLVDAVNGRKIKRG